MTTSVLASGASLPGSGTMPLRMAGLLAHGVTDLSRPERVRLAFPKLQHHEEVDDS
jgi:hypothetical protein